jgi:hypothetical protein
VLHRSGVSGAAPETEAGSRAQYWFLTGQWPNVLGVAWVLAAAVAMMVPTLRHGWSFGPSDLVSNSGLMTRSGVTLHNFDLGDQIDEMIPWGTLVWTQVHHGHIPLWNPYSALGMPLAFNWQSAAFSVPTVIGYLAPLRFAYTVQVFVTLVIAGTGAYVLGRVLRLGAIACAFIGTVYELSGPFMAWFGWSIDSVMAWAGWSLALIVLIVRGENRPRNVALFALVLALAVYSGDPDALIVMVGTLFLFSVVLLALKSRLLGGPGLGEKSLFDLIIAGVAAALLAAPLLLPGLQLLTKSVRSSSVSPPTVPTSLIIHVLLQGYSGLPLNGDRYFGGLANPYLTSVAYVGATALVLAAVGLAGYRRRREVVAFAVVAVFCVAAVFLSPVDRVLLSLPFLGKVGWHLALIPMALCIAVLAGFGMDVLVRSYRGPSVRRAMIGGFVAVGLVLLVLWIANHPHLAPSELAERSRSFWWPTAQVIFGLLVMAAMGFAWRRARARGLEGGRLWIHAGRWSGGLLLACETAFLVAVGAPMPSSSAQFLSPTPAVVALQRATGSSLVGWGVPSCFGNGAVGRGLGVPPNVNVVFGLHELALYDPVTPEAYTTAWWKLTGEPISYAAGIGFTPWYCPAITDATLARLYGVGYVLEPLGAKGPTGAVFDKRVGNENLFRIPGAALATLTPTGPSGSYPPAEALGDPVKVSTPKPSEWKIETHADAPQVLRLRLTDVPGWHATIDGHPLALHRFAGVMLQSRVPPGRHTIELKYWPDTFTYGLILAPLCALGLIGWIVLDRTRKRRVAPEAKGGP